MKTVLITGAAGGIGMQVCRMAVEEGYRVIAGAIDDWEISELESLKASLPQPDLLIPIMLDTREPEHINAALAMLEELEISFLAVVTCGAACPPAVPLEHLDIDGLTRDVFETNFFGNLKLIKGALPILKKTQGRVIHVSSLFGKTGDLGLLSYSASKHAGESMVTVLRRELKQFGIKVIITNPGVVRNTYMPHYQHHAMKNLLAKADNCSPEDISERVYDYGKNTKLRQPELVVDPNYIEASRGMISLLEGSLERSMTIDAKGCAKHIFHGIDSPKPKLRYISGLDSKILIFFTRFLPESWGDKIAAAIVSP